MSRLSVRLAMAIDAIATTAALAPATAQAGTLGNPPLDCTGVEADLRR